MALTGTLKDFGIAEILQLIGQQAKSGVLHLKSRDDVIHIAMADGNLVSAESLSRKARERLGTMLVRAEVITKEQLDRALEVQKRTLRRLGDVLVELGLVTKEDLRETTALQTTETVYRLFHWKSGTYEFEPGDVEWDRETVTPLRAESVLMEGFRQVDEWPLIRRRITSTAMTFERLRTLEHRRAARRSRRDGGDESSAGRTGEMGNVGANEVSVFDLVAPGRMVEKIVDLSCLGEFETCKALSNLVTLGYLRPIPPASRAAAAVGAYAQDWQVRLRRAAGRVLATVALAAALAGLVTWIDRHGLAIRSGGAALHDNAARRFLARYQLGRLRAALEVYRLERGEYPDQLDGLVETGLTSARDLRYPWTEEYYYRRKPGGRFVLLPPVD